MTGGSSTWEVISDIYRDLVLTGILGALIIAAFRVGSLHSKVMAALSHFQDALDEFKTQFRSLSIRVDEGFKDNSRKHEAIVREVQRLEVQTAERLAKAEEALRSD